MSTNRNIYRRSIAPHNARVMADGGIPTDNVNAAIELMRFYEEQKDSIKLFYFPALTGNKIRTSGLNKFVSKGYSMNNPQQETLANDAVQTTSTSQPYLSGNIAPNEKYALKNTNGGSNFLTHNTISFVANKSWSVTTVANNFWNNELTVADRQGLWGSPTGISQLYLNFGGYRIVDKNGVFYIFDIAENPVYTQIGKNRIVTVVFDLSFLRLYINGVLTRSIACTSCPMDINRLFSYRTFNGSVFSHIIRSGAFTASQVLSEYNLLRSYIPEIESVVIGTQTWATSNCEMAATPMGNVIPEVQSAATWATSQTLYDNAYAAQSGTVEQKTYAGVKAAAMWAHYNNDVALGAIYGKLYNWFAVKLLQMDIDYYNTTNPTTPWGWRVPTQADFQTLSTYLGGDAVSGGKIRKDGVVYWTTPNTGATNSSGFSLISGGYRDGTSGIVTSIGTYGGFWGIDLYRLRSINVDASLSIAPFSATFGLPIRLIKS